MKFKDSKYFGVKLSEHRIKNDKGQLIVTGCEFARTGKQKYHASELGLKDDKFIYLDRPYEEVKDSKTVASFEACPVTEDHPEDDVKVGVNYDKLAKGFAKNVKFVDDVPGKEGHLEADFVITDADLIKKIENHDINELSAGYNCDVDEQDWIQRHIRGNHIAVVAQARAGHSACLRDKAYKSTSKKIKTLKIGDKVMKIVDSYSYEIMDENGEMATFTDYYTEGSNGKKKFLTTIRDEANPKNAILVKINGKWKTWGGTNKDKFEEDSRYKELVKKYGKENLKFVPNKDLDKAKVIEDSNLKDNSDEELIANRRRIDQDIRKIFESHPEFSVEGFYNGVEDTEGTIYVVDYIRRKDKDPNRPRRNEYDEDEDYLEDLRDYVDKKWYDTVANVPGVNSVDIGVCEWDCDEDYNIDMLIYCDDVSRD